MRPRLAFVPGDPSGIGPELIAKLLNDPALMQALSAAPKPDEESEKTETEG